ncbi:PiggyBac transposable element-derived protein 2, partial [Trichinella britovi]
MQQQGIHSVTPRNTAVHWSDTAVRLQLSTGSKTLLVYAARYSCTGCHQLYEPQSFHGNKKYLHLADNQKLVEGDKMSKVTPLYKLLNSSLVKHGMFHEKLSIDESIVLYFGRHAAKMFLKGKPIRFGYKVWMLCGNDGYPYHMTIYQGKEIHAPKVQLSTRVIRSMVDIIQETSNTTRHTLYFDNFFNSYDLLVMLSELKMRAIGTIRPYRSNGADAVMLPDKDLMKQKREERPLSYLEFPRQVVLSLLQSERTATPRVASGSMPQFHDIRLDGVNHILGTGPQGRCK